MVVWAACNAMNPSKPPIRFTCIRRSKGLKAQTFGPKLLDGVLLLVGEGHISLFM